jgi:uncharacterized membrane protein
MNFLDILKNFSDKDISAFNDFKFKIGADISTQMIALAIAAFFVFAYLSYKSVKDLKSRNKRLLLAALRTIALFFILFIIFQPKLELREVEKIKSKMAVLLDDSLSMSLKLDSKELSRYESLKKFISEDKGYFKKLEDDFDIDYYTFGGALKKTTLSGFLEKSDAGQPRTNIGEAIESLKTISPNAEYKDLLLFTDGSDNGKISDMFYNMKTDLDRELFEKYVKSLGVNIHPAACEGEDEDFADLAVEKIVADKFGFIRTPFEIELHIYANGLGTMNIPVTLKEGDNIIKTKNLMLKKGKKNYTVNIKFYPQKIGRKVYKILLPTYARELINVNNEKSFFVNIIRDKTRVLFVVGTPTWDERFLRRTLKSNPNIDLITFMILRTSYDYLNVPEKEMSLIPFPTKEIFDEELHTFDVVIFCNFNFSPYVSRNYINNIRDYVIKDGGGFVMTGGDRSFVAGRYATTPINDILPVELSRGISPYKFGRFKPVLTDVGNVHPILRVDYNEDKNRDIYESLPAMEGINSALKVRDNAVTLMNHPKEKNEHGPSPVIAISEAGKGRSMAVLTDTLWRWNFPYVDQGGSPRIYENFWYNSLKWLVKDPELDLVKLSLKDTDFLVKDKVGIKLKVLNHKYKPTDKARIEAKVISSDRKVFKLKFNKTEAPGEYVSKFVPKKEGNYVIEASAYEGSKYLGKDIYPIIVEDPKDEYVSIDVNHKLLNELAKISKTDTMRLKDGEIKGRLKADAEKEERLLGKIELTFWDSRINFLIIIILLVAEWYIRRRYGLY